MAENIIDDLTEKGFDVNQIAIAMCDNDFLEDGGINEDLDEKIYIICDQLQPFWGTLYSGGQRSWTYPSSFDNSV